MIEIVLAAWLAVFNIQMPTATVASNTSCPGLASATFEPSRVIIFVHNAGGREWGATFRECGKIKKLKDCTGQPRVEFNGPITIGRDAQIEYRSCEANQKQ